MWIDTSNIPRIRLSVNTCTTIYFDSLQKSQIFLKFYSSIHGYKNTLFKVHEHVIRQEPKSIWSLERGM